MNWTVLKSLNEIYLSGKTKNKASLKKDAEIEHLLNTRELISLGKNVNKGRGFDDYYEKHHLQDFKDYFTFLEENELIKPQLRFAEEDIKILMDIKTRMDSGELLEIRAQMIEYEESIRGVSSMFFKNEKYLLGKNALIDAVKYVLNISELADDKDQQYIYALKCNKPKCIVLCENLDFLKRPTRPRKYNIELWYAGGRNISKLIFSETRDLPIYYSCDWDYDGLDIFQDVKEIFPQIKLLTPNAQSKDIVKSEHNSLWKTPQKASILSGLNFTDYSLNQQTIIKTLIEQNHWITEEDNDLIEMVETV
ncbi:hypothetical protein [Christiangramia sp. SM2212]|uniref:Wadjet protein JetD C-terminal domain-containing protein n=1 Tax=Christiangramia sediminicola TaxID=3073267 RepID=A0ABU1EU15_9FLAO|nr:hypothetical protein [Christiangramia sp. SM2212]MDR5591658.1 hypothetical protein [Christiangramia sp. SM2212]